MLSGKCTEVLSNQANVTISCSGAKWHCPSPVPSPRAAKVILVHKARGEGQGEGTCSILCNVRVNLRTTHHAPRTTHHALLLFREEVERIELRRRIGFGCFVRGSGLLAGEQVADAF